MNEKDIIPIEASATLMHHSRSDKYYIRHIFNALREHKELLESPDYKRLYDEAIDFLFRENTEHNVWKKDRREWGYGWIEFLADLQNSDDTCEKFSMETVNAFLAERQKIWNMNQL
ncbi:MAG: hypothetical protein E7670_05410 [Ruminococcaceae bacterium]|nr:hypothetical protein [Oscillospiraceae bacterium]